MVSSSIKYTTYVIIGLICGTLIIGSIQGFELQSSIPIVKDGYDSLKRFNSASELTEFLKNSSTLGQRLYLLESTQFPKAMNTGTSAGIDYSGTNVQVEGVDEGDRVKTDGKYLYIARGTVVYIAFAYPPVDAELISRIELSEQVGDIYIAGDKLVIFSQSNIVYNIEPMPKIPSIMPPLPMTESTNVRVYDVSNRAKPILDRDIKMEGGYVGSRMIGDYVYAIVQKNAYLIDEKAQTPVIQEGSKATQILPTEILHYYNNTEPYSSYTTILSLNTQNPEEVTQRETLLLGFSSTLYVSQKNLYLTTSTWSDTKIHKFSLYEGKILPIAEGSVLGYVLNQFSMDENDDYFRIATTNGRMWWGWRRGGITNQTSAVYILDKNMMTVGKLEGLAPREDIYSARFTGDRCYLVTFKKVDPLFVIDLSNPKNPTVLGKLKIPGYSNYLHPYDENHIIGLGKNAVESEEGDFAWYQGIKISLFDVTDVSNPIEMAMIEVGDRGTDSPALTDHRAFLFSRERGLLVIPILEAKINPDQYGGVVTDNAYGDYIYQGAYVFDISLEGIKLRGKITHIEDDSLQKSGYWFDSEYSVERSLYIGNYLYTISGRTVKMNWLTDLKEVNTIMLK
jgi:inhibitor of cysteine peptidase